MIDMIRVGQTRNLLRALSPLSEIWPRSAHHHPGQRRQSAARTGLTKVRTRSHAQKLRKSLQTERHPQKKVWQDLRQIGFDEERIVPFLTFPLDQRSIYYETRTKLLNRARPEYEANLLGNEFLLTVPEPRKETETRPIFATTLANLHVHERGSVVFPRETVNDDLLANREANIAEPAWRVFREHFDCAGERSDADARAFVGRLFRVAFAILHAPSYQAEHKSALSSDWAHLPIPKDAQLLERLCAAGEQVARLLGSKLNQAVEGQ